MLPLRDIEPNRYSRFPVMNLTLVLLNTAILIWEVNLPRDVLRTVFYLFGSTPTLIWSRQGAGVISSITSTFLHGGFFHLFGNMLFLWVFGRRVEDACGPARYLLYYLLAGTTANLTTALILPNQDVATIGASGAIFGVTGAYLLLFPTGRIRTLWFLTFIPTWPKLRAYWILLYYLLIQIPPAFDEYLNGAEYGTAYWAHLGGFLACFTIFLFLRPAAYARYRSDVAM